MLKEKVPTKNTLPSILSFTNEGKIKNCPNKQKLMKIITAIPALQKTLKGVLQPEMKGCY